MSGEPTSTRASLDLSALLNPEIFDDVVRDCAALVRREVASRSGVSGVVIKGGLKVIEKTKPQLLERVFSSLLPRFVAELEQRLSPLVHADQSITQLFTNNASEVASALLSVTDTRAQRSQLSALVKVYKKLRPLAEDQITQTTPALATLVERYVPRVDQ